MSERLYPETIEYDRSKQFLRDYKVYGNERNDDVWHTAKTIIESLQAAYRTYIFSIRKGLDCSDLYEEILEPGMAALNRATLGKDCNKTIRDCDLCMRNQIQISSEQYSELFRITHILRKNLRFIMDFMARSHKDQFDIRPQYWMENLSDDFHYFYTVADIKSIGYKL